ncbi:MAG: replication initiator protein A [Salinibacter sp.]
MAKHASDQPELIPEDELPVTPEIIRAEVNLLTLPFFALSRRGLKDKTMSEFTAVVERGDEKVEIVWRVSSSAEYGYPGPFDQKVHKAIEEIINDLPHPVENPIGFSIYQLCKRMKLRSTGGADYRKVKEALERIVATTVKSSGAFYVKGRKKWIDDVFHIYDRVIFKGEELGNGEIADKNYLYLNSWYLENLNERYVRPLDYDYYKSLGSNVAKRLYELLGVKFYGLMQAGYTSIGYRYSTLCQLLPLKRQPYQSQAKQILEPAHRQLMETQFLEDVRWSATATEERDWLVTYVPGERAVAEIQQSRGDGIGADRQSREPLRLPFEPDEEQRVLADELAKEILRVVGDEHSWPFYQRVARRAIETPMLRDLVYRVLSEVKDEARQGQIQTSRGAVFTDRLKRHCEHFGIDLGLSQAD